MKQIRTRLAVSFLILIAAFLTGCKAEQEESGTGEGYDIYYLNASATQLVENRYQTETEDTEALVEELMEEMASVPPSLDCQSALPERMETYTFRLENNVLYLYADASYAMMSAVREILCRAALTKTLTQISGVDYLSIYCGEQPIVDAAGNPVGMLSAADFVDSIRNVNSFEKVELTLYFSNEAGDRLVPEKRTVVRSTNTSLERLVVEQLIEGPEEEGCFATLPENVKLLNVSVNDSVCAVNFDTSFLNNTLEVKEYIPVYSIVNSLTELSTVNRVQIRINGSQEAVFRDSVSLNTTYERNYEYIEGGEEN